MKKAIVVGASSGIGKELATVLSNEGYIVGLVARRTENLLELQKQLPHKSFIKCIDISHPTDAKNLLEELIKEMEGMDVIIISSGVGHLNSNLNMDLEKETIDVNVSGFVVMSNIAYKHFVSKGSGHIVGVSSIGALMANPTAPAYNASKTFVSNYLVSIRKKLKLQKVNVLVTDVKCGFIDTNMAKGDKDKMFWVASPEKAALQIYDSLKKKKKTVYVSKRWRIIAWVLKIHSLSN
ncbi:SDR family NAD(P)-dependent oxidoreductase [Domibacillus aminovorans]|uniref:Oxidoreductase n=1 Tax=Domibacillus aminovorans TaxID=29332 RepID=A0A177L4H5_9BACI|nr:SDR family NAD(P)-dependent oxidoreductase [Domibacillus aminovorans]OAH60324.1 oxidoreductase [Domibacillus aminovorans]